MTMQDGSLLVILREFNIFCALFAVVLAATAAPATAVARGAFDLRFASIDGGELPLERFAGRALLVVNTASFCGYTHQYADLQELWDAYRDRGLVVLGVPSNDFKQEGGTEAKIKRFCEVNFGVDFPLTAKAHVRGPDAHPFFRFVAESVGVQALPRWNFYKYLVTPDGEVAEFWPSRVSPTGAEVIEAIERVLPEGFEAEPRPEPPAAVPAPAARPRAAPSPIRQLPPAA